MYDILIDSDIAIIMWYIYFSYKIKMNQFCSIGQIVNEECDKRLYGACQQIWINWIVWNYSIIQQKSYQARSVWEYMEKVHS